MENGPGCVNGVLCTRTFPLVLDFGMPLMCAHHFVRCTASLRDHCFQEGLTVPSTEVGLVMYEW